MSEDGEVISSCSVLVKVSRRRMRGEAGSARSRSGAGAANGNGSYPPISAAYWLPPSNPMPYHVPGDTLYCPHMTSHVDLSPPLCDHRTITIITITDTISYLLGLQTNIL